MIWRLFRPSQNVTIVERLHGAIVDAARSPELYLAYGVADTFEGRFEMLALQACLVLRRLKALPAPADALAQDLADALFRNLEVGLREMGVGDTTVPKRMNQMAEAFFGRATAYAAGLAGEGDLEGALRRNALDGRGDPARLARLVRAQGAAFDAVDLDAFTDGPTPFVDPAAVD